MVRVEDFGAAIELGAGGYDPLEPRPGESGERIAPIKIARIVQSVNIGRGNASAGRELRRMGQKRGHARTHGRHLGIAPSGLELRAVLRRATGVTLLLYGAADPVNPLFECRLDARANKSGRIWHCWVPADRAGQAAYYAWRVEGRHDPAEGYRFDAEKILLDPFAPAVFFPPDYDRFAACQPGPNDGRAPLGVLPKTVPAFRTNAARAAQSQPRSDRL